MRNVLRALNVVLLCAALILSYALVTKETKTELHTITEQILIDNDL